MGVKLITEITPLAWGSLGLAAAVGYYYLTEFVIITIYHMFKTIQRYRDNRRERYLNRPHTTWEKLDKDGCFRLDVKHRGNAKMIMKEINKFKDLNIKVKKD